jgi:hypothetical protein
MKLVDTDETVVLVTGTSLRSEEADRPLAYWIKQEVDRRGAGHAYRRAVVVGDRWYLENGVFQLNPTIAIGGPGVNGVSAEFAESLPMAWSRDERVFVQADFTGDLRRAALWGADAEATTLAVEHFLQGGLLEELLGRIWRFRSEMYV